MHACHSLADLDFKNNHLSGTIPIEFDGLSSLTNLELDRNDLTGTMPDGVCDVFLSLSSVENLPVVDCDEVYCPCCEGCVLPSSDSGTRRN